jgi:Arc/MetJ-type ribon-helix-helix transcriptional regulator
MHIEIAPETERLVREEIANGHVGSVDEIIHAGVQALREKNTAAASGSAADAKNLVELFANSPFKGLDIQFERDRDYGREIEL